MNLPNPMVTREGDAIFGTLLMMLSTLDTILSASATALDAKSRIPLATPLTISLPTLIAADTAGPGLRPPVTASIMVLPSSRIDSLSLGPFVRMAPVKESIKRMIISMPA